MAKSLPSQVSYYYYHHYYYYHYSYYCYYYYCYYYHPLIRPSSVSRPM